MSNNIKNPKEILGLSSSFIVSIRNEKPVFQYSHLSQQYSSRLFSLHCQNLIIFPLVQSASFSLKSLQHPCELKDNVQCKVVKYP